MELQAGCAMFGELWELLGPELEARLGRALKAELNVFISAEKAKMLKFQRAFVRGIGKITREAV